MNVLRAGSHLMALILPLSFSGPASASVDAFEEYPVLKAADYEAATGCASVGRYYHFLASAMGFLAGTSDEDIRYIQRETVALFDDLLQRTPEGYLDGKCLDASVWRIGVAIEFIDAEGAFVWGNITGRYDKATQKWDNVIRNRPDLADVSQNSAAIVLLPRSTFMKRTECLVSPSTYNHYVKAFTGTLFNNRFSKDTRQYMKEFMEDLFESRPTPEGFVNERCMAPAITRLADELGLLDEQGRYQSLNQ